MKDYIIIYSSFGIKKEIEINAIAPSEAIKEFKKIYPYSNIIDIKKKRTI